MTKSPNKRMLSDSELHPLERTPQSNEESSNAKVHTT